jgi:AcrR family transcriptional regulator
LNSVKIKAKRKPAKKLPAKKPSPKAAIHAYHHGDLREKLIAATEAILEEKGVEGFSLREAARRVGVSPAAPAHHFGDVAGLLAAVAREGFAEFGRMLREADESGGNDPTARLIAQGKAYVAFAMKRPARFKLMFQSDKIDFSRGDLPEIAADSFDTLERAIRALLKLPKDAPMTTASYGALLATWSVVHGFSYLALGHQLDNAAEELGGHRAILEKMLPAMLDYLPKGKP